MRNKLDIYEFIRKNKVLKVMVNNSSNSSKTNNPPPPQIIGHMALEIQVLSWDRQTNVARLNRIPVSPIDNCISIGNTYIKYYNIHGYELRMKMMFGSSLPPVVCWMAHALFTFFVFACAYWCPTHIVFVFLCLLYLMLPVFLDCLFFIAPSIFLTFI